MTRWLVALAFASALLGVVSGGAPPAEGAFPGMDGLLVQSGTGSPDAPLVVVQPDGTGVVDLTPPNPLSSCCHGATWSPGGREIAFWVGLPGGERDILVRNMKSGAIEELPYASGPDAQGALGRIRQYGASPLAWSPDGNAVVFSSQEDTNIAALWTIRRDASGDWAIPIPVTGFDPLVSEPSWATTPAGERIVFSANTTGPVAQGPRELHLSTVSEEPYHSDVTDTRLTFDADADDHRPDFSPDGTQIAWQHDAEVWVMSHSGEEQRKVIDGSFQFWSPEGRIVAEDGDGFFTIDADGQNRTTLPAFPGGSDWGSASSAPPVPAPDSRIVYVSDRETGTGEPAELYTIDPDGTNRARLTQTPGSESEPAWSADGRRIAFERGGELFTIDADGSDETRVTSTSDDFEMQPAWSPDGTRLVFSRNGELFSIRLDGGTNEVQLTNHPDFTNITDTDPDWSPDGQKIVFRTDRDDDALFRAELYVMNADGTGLVRLTNDDLHDQGPNWSADGSRIVWQRENAGGDNQDDIYVMNADGTGKTSVTSGSEREAQPAWSPDGKKIVFASGALLSTIDPGGTGLTPLTGGAVPEETSDHDPDWGLVTSVMRTLTVTKSGDGTGTVTSEFGIDCGADCEHAYSDGAVVGLVQTPDPGSTFTAWSNCDEVLDGQCSVTMRSDRSIVATFVASGDSQLAVSSLSPSSGPTSGGTTVTITGTGFDGATAVAFGASPAASFSVDSATQITAVSQPHAAGTVDVLVTGPDGTSANTPADDFTFLAPPAPAVTDLTPDNGPTAGGTAVTIAGSNLTGATAVTFGGVEASFTVDSATQLTATSPPHAAGTVDVLVTGPAGASANTAADDYTFVLPPLSADVAATVSATPNPVALEAPFLLVVGARNSGPAAATDVVVDVAMSSFPRWNPAPAGCGLVGSQNLLPLRFRCALGNLESGESATRTFALRLIETDFDDDVIWAQSLAPLLVTVTASAGVPDPAQGNQSASTAIEGLPRSGCTLLGTPGSDNLVGTAGNDVICGVAGEDTIDGGGGNDVIWGGSGADLISGGAGADDLVGVSGDDTLLGNLGNDDLLGGDGDDSFDGGFGADRINGFGVDVDTVTYATRIAPVTVDLGDGGGPEDGEVGEGDDVSWVEVLIGGSGNDTLRASFVGLRLFGGLGNDLLQLRPRCASCPEKLADGGPGTDTFQLRASIAGVRVDLTKQTASDMFLGVPVEIRSMEAAIGSDFDDILTGVSLDGGPGNDLLTGTDGVDRLDGGYDNDALYGLGGDDFLEGGVTPLPVESNNADYLDGGVGHDALSGGSGADVLVGGPGVDNLGGGGSSDQLFGGGGNDALGGGSGRDLLDGGPGADLLVGGDDLVTDVVSYADRTVRVTGDADGNADDGAAGEGDNAIDVDGFIGGSGNDTLHGGYLEGRAGDDTLRGPGSGCEAYGGPGDDDIRGAEDPIVSPETEGCNLDGGPGNDFLRGTFTEDFLQGGEGDDELRASARRDTLDGGPGADLLDGGTGVDRVFYGNHTTGVVADLDGDRDDGAPGENDRILTNIEDLAGGAGDDRLTGDGSRNTLEGGPGADTLVGNGSADRLLGHQGDDVFEGGSGSDFIEGGEGNDLVDGGSGGDNLHGGDSFFGDVGRDTLTYASRSADVSVDADGVDDDGAAGEADLVHPGFEIIIGGSGDDTLTGDQTDDRLVGNGGDDVLRGLFGSDVLLGGNGADTLWGGAGDDFVFGEAGADLMFGEIGKDVMVGAAGNDRLFGGADDDDLAGGTGTNQLFGGSGFDRCNVGDAGTVSQCESG